MNHLPILYLDMDGVLADFAGAINAIDPSVHVGAVDDGSANWERERKRVMSICIDNPRIFLTLPALPGAIDAVYELMKTWDVHFASTPMQAVHASYGDKALWLDMHLGDGAHKRLVLTHRKDMLRGDVLVDDRTVNGAGQFRGFFIQHESWEYTLPRLEQLRTSRKWWPSCP